MIRLTKQLLTTLLLCLCTIGAWADGAEMGVAYTVTGVTFIDWTDTHLPSEAFVTGADSAKVTVSGSAFVTFKYIDGNTTTTLKEGTWNNDKPQQICWVKGDALTAALAGNFILYTGGNDNVAVTVTNYDSTHQPSTSGGTSGGTDGGSASGETTYTTAEKIALKMQLTDVPTIYLTVPDALNADGTAMDINSVLYKDANGADYHSATIQIVDAANSMEVFTDSVEMKVRGNSTAYQTKRPYRLKFAKGHKHDLLGNGYSCRNWTLLANAVDPTMVRNALTYKVGELVGEPFCPGYKFVDVVINGEYRGTYQISDHVEVDKNRVNIDGDTGWFLESARGDMIESPSVSSAAMAMSIKNPEPETDDETTALQTQIQEWFKPLDNLFGFNGSSFSLEAFADPVSGWRKYWDEESLVNFYVGINITGDYDGFMTVKMYRDLDKKLKFGPLWDKDLAYGNWSADNGRVLAEDQQTGFYFASYVKKLWQDPVFIKKVHDKLHTLVDNGLSTTLIDYVEQLAASVKETEALNKTKWTGYGSWASSYSTYAEAVQALKDYLAPHITWLTETIDTQYAALGGDAIVDNSIAGDDYSDGSSSGGSSADIPETSTYEYTGVTDTGYKIPASAFNPAATSIEVTLTRANGTASNVWGFYGYNGSEWNANGISGSGWTTYTISITSADDITAVCTNGVTWHLQCSDGSVGDITATVKNIGVPASGDDSCTSHTYNDGKYISNGDGTYSRACDNCGTAEADGKTYYKFTVYPEAAESTDVYTTTKAWTADSATPNALAYVDADSGITGTNIVNDGVCDNFVITDGHPLYIPSKFTATKASYTRNVNSAWGTICLPFKMQNASTDYADIYHLGSISADGQTMIFTPIDPASGAGAYKPMVFRAKDFAEGGTKDVIFTADEVTVKKSSESKTNSTVSGWMLCGTTELLVIDDVTADADLSGKSLYYINGDKFWKATKRYTNNAFRAYFVCDDASESKASFDISTGGILTGISNSAEAATLAVFTHTGGVSIIAQKDMHVTICNAAGAVVASVNIIAGKEHTVALPAGVYIINKVKFIVK